MSRAINIDATPQHVTAACAKRGFTITSLETLLSGGTRVVLTSGDAANAIRQVYGRKVIEGQVQRSIASVR